MCIYALWTPKVRNNNAHICATDPKEFNSQTILMNKLFGHQLQGHMHIPNLLHPKKLQFANAFAPPIYVCIHIRFEKSWQGLRGHSTEVVIINEWKLQQRTWILPSEGTKLLFIQRIIHAKMFLPAQPWSIQPLTVMKSAELSTQHTTCTYIGEYRI